MQTILPAKKKYLTALGLREYNTTVSKFKFMAGGSTLTEQLTKRSLLYDFYGELLTDKQKEYYDMHYNQDLSLSEIAEETGITRQGVWDIIRRAEERLQNMENKTGLIEKYLKYQEIEKETRKVLNDIKVFAGKEALRNIADLEKKLEQLEG